MLRATSSLTLACLFSAALATQQSSDTDQKFLDYLAQHGKEYQDEQEFQQRKQIWIETDSFINDANQANASFQLGHNFLSDMTPEERKIRCGYKPKPQVYQHIHQGQESEEEIPESVDWRDQGVVNPVKNQGQCGSCWAFSAAGALESAYAIKTGKLVSISEQQLVDCDKQSDGCSGGTQDSAFDYYTQFNAELENKYVYKAKDEPCKFDKSKISDVADVSHTTVKSSDVRSMKIAVAKNPVSVAIEADKPIFQQYRGGIFDSEECGTGLDHAVLIVGYGKDDEGREFWIMRNSWGTSWGEDGYMRMAIEEGRGTCGVQMAPLYPNV